MYFVIVAHTVVVLVVVVIVVVVVGWFHQICVEIVPVSRRPAMFTRYISILDLIPF